MSPAEAAARARADQARERISTTLAELQTRLSPSTIAHNAWEGAVDRGSDIAGDAADFVRQRPGPTAAVAGTIVAFLLGRPLVRRIRRKRRARRRVPAQPVAPAPSRPF
jgi:ElaB/YqjD/DUF883 family membrane-anchored ribosome-binding protein